MGFRFSKRVKILPGVSLNFSKSGVSTSLGPPGAKVTIGHGKIRQTVGIPGTGLSYTSMSPLASERDKSIMPAAETAVVPVTTESSFVPATSRWTAAAHATGKVLYWLTIGIFVVVGSALIAILATASGAGKRRR